MFRKVNNTGVGGGFAAGGVVPVSFHQSPVVLDPLYFSVYIITFQLFKGRDNPPPGAPHAWCRSAGLHAQHAAEAVKHNVLQRQGVAFGLDLLQYGGDALALHSGLCGVRLRVAAHLHHPVSLPRQGGGEVGCGGGFPNSSFAVYSDLPNHFGFQVYVRPFCTANPIAAFLPHRSLLLNHEGVKYPSVTFS